MYLLTIRAALVLIAASIPAIIAVALLLAIPSSAGWQARPHDALREPFRPGKAMSPNDKYASLVAAAGYLPLVLRGEDYLELCRWPGGPSTTTASASLTAPTTRRSWGRGGPAVV